MTLAAASRVPTGEWSSESENKTYELGRELGSRLQGGEIILLEGPLGAGKTIFTKGIASALSINSEDVTSPSFTLVNIHEGRHKLYHLDLYRLPDGAAAAHAVDLDELLTDEQGVFVIEWAERMGRYRLPPPVWRVSIGGDGDDTRRIVIEAT